MWANKLLSHFPLSGCVRCIDGVQKIHILLPARTQTHLTDENQNIEEKTQKKKVEVEEVKKFWIYFQRWNECPNHKIYVHVHMEKHTQAEN